MGVGERHDSLWWFVHAPVLSLKLWPLLRDTRLSVSQVFDRLFGDDEGPKLALASKPGAITPTIHARLWWPFSALALGGFLVKGGVNYANMSYTLDAAGGLRMPLNFRASGSMSRWAKPLSG